MTKKHRKLAAVATNRSVDSFPDIVQSQVQNYPAADTEARLQEQMCIDNEVYSRLMAMESGIRAQVAKQFKGEAWHSARQLIPQDSHTIANAAKHNYKNNLPFTNYNAADWRRLQRQRAAPEFHYANEANHDREATHLQAFFRGWSSRRRWRERRAMHEEDGRKKDVKLASVQQVADLARQSKELALSAEEALRCMNEVLLQNRSKTSVDNTEAKVP